MGKSEKNQGTGPRPDFAARRFHVWADGSFHKGLMGGGVRVFEGRDEEYRPGRDRLVHEESFPVVAPFKADSTLAEVFTAAAGLAEVPDGAPAVVHSDCKFVVHHINDRDFTHRKPALADALARLHAQVSRLGGVTASEDYKSPNLHCVHNLSVRGRMAAAQR